MSYVRSPIYIIRTQYNNLNCFDTNDPESEHHHGFWNDPYRNDQQIYDHMRWHIKRFEEENKFDEAHWLEDQLMELLTLPYYTKWYHMFDPWRWLFWPYRYL